MHADIQSIASLMVLKSVFRNDMTPPHRIRARVRMMKNVYAALSAVFIVFPVFFVRTIMDIMILMPQ